MPPGIFNDKTTLQAAVDLWTSNPTSAEAEYGPISDWNVPQVTFRELGLTGQQITTLLEGIMSVMCSQQMFPSVTCMVSRGNRDTLLLPLHMCLYALQYVEKQKWCSMWNSVCTSDVSISAS